MIKIKLSSGSKHSKPQEARAIKNLQRILSREDGYLIPVMFVGEQLTNREIDAVLLLPDIIFFIDFKDWWPVERIEVDGLNGTIRRFFRGHWEVEENTLADYEYAARIMAAKLKKPTTRRWLPTSPRIHSVLVFTRPPNAVPARVSFAGGDPTIPREGVGACNIEQLPPLINAFRAANTTRVHLNSIQLSTLVDFFLAEMKPLPDQGSRRIETYRITAEHHTDTFLDCKVFLGEDDLFNEQVWVKEYERVFTSPEERNQKDRLILRHVDVLRRFPQHEHIVKYCNHKITDFHLYVFLSRKPGIFLSELLYGKLAGNTPQTDLPRFPFNLQARLHILGGLLRALDYLVQQPGFEHSAYRDLRPDNIFLQLTDTFPVAQLFNLDCTKIPGSHTKHSNLRSGHNRFPLWDDYASPELLEYIDTTSDILRANFTGDVSSDLFSWAIIAWEMLVGELPFVDARDKLMNRHKPWPGLLVAQLQPEADKLSQRAIQLIEECLDRSPARRPSLTTLRSHFP